MKRAALALSLCACAGPTPSADVAARDAVAPDAAPDAPAPSVLATHSSSIAVSPDGRRLFVVNPEADSVSVLDPQARSLLREVLLAPARPAPDPSTRRFEPAVGPRYLAFDARRGVLYVSGQRSGELLAVDPEAGRVLGRLSVGSEPAGVLLGDDGATAFVALSQENSVARVETTSLRVTNTVATAERPWGLAWSAERATLLVGHLVVPSADRTRTVGVTVVDPNALTVRERWDLPWTAPRGMPFERRLANGEARGLYDLAPRPGSQELWTAHLLLATSTEQQPLAVPMAPGLDFESTVFPALTLFDARGAVSARLSTDAAAVRPRNGAFGDVVSGPHALTFTADGRYAFVVDSASEDVLVVDAERRVESSLLRPLPGHLPEGIALAPDERHAYVDERNTGDVAVLSVQRSADGAPVLSVEGAPLARFAQGDPMPARLRLGQHLFFSANSDELPLTQNHWVACASCHVEGRSDAVVWLFAQGPRDTPSNAGGVLGTGFLLHTADRRDVRDYSETIFLEQGGGTDPHSWATDPALSPLLDALQDFVNLGLPRPVPPRTDAARVALGSALFHSPTVGCASCHRGALLTDSGDGNATLDLAGAVLLHDVGSCNTGTFPDRAHTDATGRPRAACLFDTPSLRGLADSAPYLHDGAALTLRDVLERTRGHMGDLSGLTESDLGALVEYLRSL